MIKGLDAIVSGKVKSETVNLAYGHGNVADGLAAAGRHEESLASQRRSLELLEGLRAESPDDMATNFDLFGTC